ncbi:BTB/POZ domain-containing protein 9 [Habropoda laboriosa]|uniref:BTB/POZ domain-containing protein 9 n=1 Tax=Habropoda laboriosa TaxID=597456 RepID=A0A0L7RJN8_9HYME|nr:BTB/POZ domain-containing protein 9 [Habropoda laboriosa]
MCSQHEMDIIVERLHTDVINHISTLSENIGALYLSDDYSDVTLIVGGQRFNSHKIILAARSQYFRALLFGGLKESTQREIELKDANLVGFKGLLEYIYTGRMSLTNQREEVVLDILGLAHLYGFSELEASISDYLKEILDIKNVCLIFDAALRLEFLTRVCHEHLDEHACNMIKHESFLQLSADALNELVSRDSFYAPEIDIFLAVRAWVKANPDADGKTVLDKVRLSLVSITDLLNVVRPTGLVSPDAILDAIAARAPSRDSDLNYRGQLLIDVDVARPVYGAQVLQGEMRSFLLDGDTSNYDMERGSRNALLNGDTSNYDWDSGYTCHQVGSGSILVQLGQPYIIDSIRLLLWDCDDRSYSYYIEVSGNSWNWVLVADKTKEACRSWQTIRFESPRPVVFIRIVGTHNTENEVFHCVHFECPAQINDKVVSKSSVQKGKQSKGQDSMLWLVPVPPETATEAVNIDQEGANSSDYNVF